MLMNLISPEIRINGLHLHSAASGELQKKAQVTKNCEKTSYMWFKVIEFGTNRMNT